ncbi:MAG: hypothetical protein GY711_09385 [bacterium]|nr:hypothetical protein [bacterium]
MNTRALLCIVAAPVLAGSTASAQNNLPVSVSSSGALANNDSYYSLISTDGRYVVFQSEAANLAANDPDSQYDIFRRDLQTGTTELVSVSTSGNSGSGLSLSPAVSGEGRWVAWSSNGSNLVAGDTNGTWDVFLRDMQLGITTRISVDGAGSQALDRSDQPRMTPDASYIVFESDADLIAADTNTIKDCYRLERLTGQLELVSTSTAGVQGNNISYAAQPSDDGRYVVFFSSASNLVNGDTNGWGDVFWKDMQTGVLSRANVSTSGAQTTNESIWPSISGDGLTVTFCSRSGNLVGGDTNGHWDLFARDIHAATTTRLNLQPGGAQADSYVRSPTALSTDGRFVIFASLSTNLVPSDTNGFQDIFLRDRQLETTARLSLDSSGTQTDDDSFVPHMTPDVRVITYTSEAADVVPGDTNGFRDIFAAELFGDIGTSYCGPAIPNSTGSPATIAANGSTTVAANNLQLTASTLPPGQFGYFLVGETQGFFSPPGSTGFICLTANIGRFNAGSEIFVGPTGSLQVDLTALPVNPPVAVQPGETWNFQCWYRDIGGTNNFTDGISITFQ